MKKMIPKGAFILSAIGLTMVFVLYALKNRSAFDSTADIIIFIAAFLCCFAILIFSVLLLLVKKWPIDKIFLVVSGMIGLLSFFINTPGTVPDEGVHISNTYLWSNRLLGISESLADQQISNVYITYDSYIRKGDLDAINEVVKDDASIANYQSILRKFSFFMPSEDAKLVAYNLRDNSISPVAYFPAILGITMARLLRLGSVPMLYLGKLFMLAFYISGFYWSIKRIPMGKTALFILSILPMCVNLAPSFSYDSVIITFSMMLIAQILYLAYGNKQKVGLREVITSAALVFLFSPLKVMVYLPMVLLFFIIPKSEFSSAKRYYVFCFSMLAVGILSIIVSNLSVLLAYSPSDNQLIFAGKPTYTAEWILHHPIKTIYIVMYSTAARGYWYCQTMIGSSLGWLNIPVASWIINGLALCLLSTCLNDKNHMTNAITKKQRLWFVLCAALVYLLFMMGMMIWWTPSGTRVVQGIQGRYFIPVLPLILFSLYGIGKVKKDYGRVQALVSIVLSLSAFSNILIAILLR